MLTSLCRILEDDILSDNFAGGPDSLYYAASSGDTVYYEQPIKNGFAYTLRGNSIDPLAVGLRCIFRPNVIKGVADLVLYRGGWYRVLSGS